MITIPENWILYINIALAVFYLIFVIYGARQGVFRQLVSLAGSALALFGAWRYCQLLSRYFSIVPKEWLPLQDTMLASTISGYANTAIWFILIFLILRLIFSIIEHIIGTIQQIPGIKQASSILGGILGAIQATVWVFIMCMFLTTSAFKNGDYVVKNTVLGVIHDGVSEKLSEQGIPVSIADAVNQLYMSSKDLSDNDKKAIETWLKEQGYEPATPSAAQPMSPRMDIKAES